MSQSLMSVSSLNIKIKSLLEVTFMHILVEGEVASITYHTSGHLYFSIKDKKSSIKCVMWRSSVSKLKFRIEKGMHIFIEGSVGVYTPRGEYQFYAVHIEPYGKGTLALAYDQLKKRLKAKGYFDAHSKKPIPKYIKKIALVTAKESAALYDMLKIIEQRWASVEVLILDTLVQGDRAAIQIVKSLRHADSLEVDVVVVARGGGSMEDLWCFNEEIVADALFAMQTPVVSAVGHEVDIVLSDFVADLRAPTPSGAMQMILPDSQEILYALSEINERFSYAITQKLNYLSRDLKHLEEVLLNFSPFVQLIRIDSDFNRFREEFKRVIRHKLEYLSLDLPELQKNYLQNLSLNIQQKEQYLKYLNKKLKMSNPLLQYRKGWAQISEKGTIINLETIEVDKKFILENGVVKIKALCLSKEYL